MPPLESSVKLPVLVSIVLSFAMPMRILSTSAPPFASRRPVIVEIPRTVKCLVVISVPIEDPPVTSNPPT